MYPNGRDVDAGNPRNALLIGGLLLAGGILGCGGMSDPGGGDPQPAAVTIAGTVHDAESGEAVIGAMLAAGAASATTDANGRYELSGLSSGPVHLEVTAAGFETYATDLSLVEGQNIHHVKLLVLRARVSGRVTRQDDGLPLEGATVHVGGKNVTADADGSYEVTGLRPDDYEFTVEADGFDPVKDMLTLPSGETVRDVALGTQTLFYSGDYAIFVPREVEALRGVVLYIAGQERDQRYVATGERPEGYPTSSLPDAWIDFWVGPMRDLARRHGLAIMGTILRNKSDADLDEVFAMIDQFAGATGHPELSGAALLPSGFSEGGCFVNLLAARNPERIIAFTAFRPTCAVPGEAGGYEAGDAATLPGLFDLYDGDDVLGPTGNDLIATSFDANRATGAPWALAIEPSGAHNEWTTPTYNFWLAWLDSTIERRLDGVDASTVPITLNPTDQTTGWLGDRGTFDIAAYDDYSGDELAAAWLPSEESATLWRALVGGM
ncbi:MAG: carboxypeptidase-like regulatory domain-containing protein [Gemmatimonadales bacterium]|jgi:hypothetical protein